MGGRGKGGYENGSHGTTVGWKKIGKEEKIDRKKEREIELDLGCRGE